MLGAVVLWQVTCARPSEPAVPATPWAQHAGELAKIMKTEVNEAFSALSFQVFHADGPAFDYAALRAPTAALRGGLARVHSVVVPSAHTDEARTVFFSFLDNMERHAARFDEALGRRADTEMADALSRIARTCNDCHHFFRLDKLEDVPTDRHDKQP